MFKDRKVNNDNNFVFPLFQIAILQIDNIIFRISFTYQIFIYHSD